MITTAPAPTASKFGPRRHRRALVQSSLEMYFQEIHRTPLLNARDEKEVALRVTRGDYAARELMVRANLRLVVNIARRYLNRGVDLHDLIAEGNLGLLRAVQDFDPHRNLRFSTYATHWIRQAIGHALVSSGPTIRIPAYMLNLLSHWRRAAVRLCEEHGRPATPEEIADYLQLPPSKVCDISKAIRLLHRSPQTTESEDHPPLERQVEDGRSKPPEVALIEREDRQHLLELVDHMPPRESAVLRWRFGLNGEDPLTLEEIGRLLGVTRERVRQIETKALAKLRERLLHG